MSLKFRVNLIALACVEGHLQRKVKVHVRVLHAQDQDSSQTAPDCRWVRRTGRREGKHEISTASHSEVLGLDVHLSLGQVLDSQQFSLNGYGDSLGTLKHHFCLSFAFVTDYSQFYQSHSISIHQLFQTFDLRYARGDGQVNRKRSLSPLHTDKQLSLHIIIVNSWGFDAHDEVVHASLRSLEFILIEIFPSILLPDPKDVLRQFIQQLIFVYNAERDDFWFVLLVPKGHTDLALRHSTCDTLPEVNLSESHQNHLLNFGESRQFSSLLEHSLHPGLDISYLSQRLIHRYYEIVIKYIDSQNVNAVCVIIVLNMSKYQGRVDPLEQLRSAYVENKRVKLKDKHLLFDKDIRLPLNQPTAWVSPLTKKQYSLGSLWLFMEYHLQHITDYLSKIAEYGVDNVTISDREAIINYFLGKVSDSNCISQELKLQLSMKGNTRKEQPQEEEGKKPKPEFKLPFELEVIDYISKFQRPTSSKTRSLRCPSKSFEGLLKLLKVNPGDEAPKVEERKLRINSILERKKNPIIIVPEHSQTGNLCIDNVEKFLLDGEYTEHNESGPFAPLHRIVEIGYTLKGKKTVFDITNNPSLLGLPEWQNVVAIFVQGRKNEFQTWAIKDPLEIFKRAKGFLLKFPTKEQSEGHEWNIKVFNLDRNVRYRDSNIQRAIWSEIEAFLYEKI